jgi:hypothetical protein
MILHRGPHVPYVLDKIKTAQRAIGEKATMMRDECPRACFVSRKNCYEHECCGLTAARTAVHLRFAMDYWCASIKLKEFIVRRATPYRRKDKEFCSPHGCTRFCEMRDNRAEWRRSRVSRQIAWSDLALPPGCDPYPSAYEGCP